MGILGRGAEAVTANLRNLGIDGITVSRSCLDLISDWLGATKEMLPTMPSDWEEADVGAGKWEVCFCPIGPPV